MGLPVWRAPSPTKPKDSLRNDATAASRSPIRRSPPTPPARSRLRRAGLSGASNQEASRRLEAIQRRVEDNERGADENNGSAQGRRGGEEVWRSTLADLWGDEHAVPIDGLGDRERSFSPDEDRWEVIHTTIAPDATLPSADSSFTSAAASASFTGSLRNSSANSSSSSLNSSRTHLTVPSPRRALEFMALNCESSDDDDSDTDDEAPVAYFPAAGAGPIPEGAPSVFDLPPPRLMTRRPRIYNFPEPHPRGAERLRSRSPQRTASRSPRPARGDGPDRVRSAVVDNYPRFRQERLSRQRPSLSSALDSYSQFRRQRLSHHLYGVDGPLDTDSDASTSGPERHLGNRSDALTEIISRLRGRETRTGRRAGSNSEPRIQLQADAGRSSPRPNGAALQLPPFMDEPRADDQAQRPPNFDFIDSQIQQLRQEMDSMQARIMHLTHLRGVPVERDEN